MGFYGIPIKLVICMSTNFDVQIQQRGRITIPDNVRKRHDLKDGDWITLKLVTEDEQPVAAPGGEE